MKETYEYTKIMEKNIMRKLIELNRHRKKFILYADERAFINEEFSKEMHKYCKDHRIYNEHLPFGKILFLKASKNEGDILMKDRILRHLMALGSITSFEAIREYGCTRLSHYIYLLRNEGYNITDVTIKSKNRFGEPNHFKRYILKKENQQDA